MASNYEDAEKISKRELKLSGINVHFWQKLNFATQELKIDQGKTLFNRNEREVKGNVEERKKTSYFCFLRVPNFSKIVIFQRPYIKLEG